MNIFTRLSNGWTIAMNSFKVLKANKQLIVFPILSGFSLLLVTASFFTAALAKSGWEVSSMGHYSKAVQYGLLFLFYFVNYFVIVFFNVALMHCTRMYFKGEEVNLREGLNYSISRLWAIFSWALFAATVGALLRIMQENVGKIGKIIIGLIGIVWNVATFFVVPIIAYENGNALYAFKRSAQMMKEKWGEKIGASFSFGLMQFIAIILVVAVAALAMEVIHPVAGIAVAALGIAFVLAIMSAAQSIFISAVYHNVTGDPIEHHHQIMIDDLFVQK
ncbi:hypothetical protein FC093_14565 [Ilyomonas limi]|uniref:Glycerophosphoryl diester phosphodiesterase membrane domain-containing protein n=1 Tax=Ilyomonas limi TaxID=2575867 RepID=A0A4U3KY08_9BACT|nr:DUF6159 family protein [Ilyomonas limi]TKK67508.1 hypothetical protein FC093_14565 [Ilyomonas limi]